MGASDSGGGKGVLGMNRGSLISWEVNVRWRGWEFSQFEFIGSMIELHRGQWIRGDMG